MSHLKITTGSSTPSTQAESSCNPTTIKVGIFVVSFLLLNAGLFLHFKGINSIAEYSCYAAGGVGLVIALALFLSRKKNSLALSIDLSKESGQLTITQEDVSHLLKNYPSARRINIELPYHADDRNWNPNFKALDRDFISNIGASSGSCYVYDRR